MKVKAILTISFGFILMGMLGSLLLYGLEGHDKITSIIISAIFVIIAFVAYELFKIGFKSLKENKSDNEETWNDHHG